MKVKECDFLDRLRADADQMKRLRKARPRVVTARELYEGKYYTMLIEADWKGRQPNEQAGL